MEWFFYTVALPVALAFLASVIYALHWCSRKGHFNQLNQQALSIFDDSEPVGKCTDSFPKRRMSDHTSR